MDKDQNPRQYNPRRSHSQFHDEQGIEGVLDRNA
jgi:hypothetical protein